MRRCEGTGAAGGTAFEKLAYPHLLGHQGKTEESCGLQSFSYFARAKGEGGGQTLSLMSQSVSSRSAQRGVPSGFTVSSAPAGGCCGSGGSFLHSLWLLNFLGLVHLASRKYGTSHLKTRRASREANLSEGSLAPGRLLIRHPKKAQKLEIKPPGFQGWLDWQGL